MGFLRGACLIFVSTLLFISFLAGGTFLTLGLSLDYKDVHPVASEIASGIVNQSLNSEKGLNNKIEESIPPAKEYCENNTEYVFNYEGQTFTLDCDSISKSTDEIIQEQINKTVTNYVKDFYYKDYTCEFWKCFESEETPLFLVSEYAKEYWFEKFYTTLIFSIILFALGFLLAKNKANSLIINGALLFVASFPVAKLQTIGTAIAKTILGSVSSIFLTDSSNQIIDKIVSLFFSEAHNVFWWMLGIGLLLVSVGVILRIMKIGLKISNKINKIKEESKKDREQSKENSKEEK